VLAVTINLLHKRNLISLLVEGGSELLGSFIKAGLWDEARIFTNMSLEIGDGVAVPDFDAGSPVESFEMASDKLDIYVNPTAK
jgi:diaminohydroxyphosphoribosylaminopyrimidine deaminase/5-amino-6-(5-phosphoribosylamino)uracil reductase